MYSSNETSRRLSPENIAEILVSEGEVTEDQMQRALDKQRREGVSLGEVLVSNDYLAAEDLARVLSRRLNMEYVVLSQEEVDPELIGIVGEETLVQCEAVPLRVENGKLVVAMSDPADAEARSCVVESAGQPIIPVAAAEDAIRTTRDRLLKNHEQERVRPARVVAMIMVGSKKRPRVESEAVAASEAPGRATYWSKKARSPRSNFNRHWTCKIATRANSGKSCFLGPYSTGRPRPGPCPQAPAGLRGAHRTLRRRHRPGGYQPHGRGCVPQVQSASTPFRRRQPGRSHERPQRPVCPRRPADNIPAPITPVVVAEEDLNGALDHLFGTESEAYEEPGATYSEAEPANGPVEPEGAPAEETPPPQEHGEIEEEADPTTDADFDSPKASEEHPQVTRSRKKPEVSPKKAWRTPSPENNNPVSAGRLPGAEGLGTYSCRKVRSPTNNCSRCFLFKRTIRGPPGR